MECTKAGYERSHVAHGVTHTVKDRMAGDCPADQRATSSATLTEAVATLVSFKNNAQGHVRLFWVNFAGEEGWTSLLAAAMDGDPVLIQLLLDNKAEVDKAANDGGTPLHVAAQQGNLAVIKLLLENKAEVDKAMNDGATPLHVAAQQGHLAVCN